MKPSFLHGPVTCLLGGSAEKNKRILLKVQFKLIQSVFNKLHRYHGHVYVKGSLVVSNPETVITIDRIYEMGIVFGSEK